MVDKELLIEKSNDEKDNKNVLSNFHTRINSIKEKMKRIEKSEGTEKIKLTLGLKNDFKKIKEDKEQLSNLIKEEENKGKDKNNQRTRDNIKKYLKELDELNNKFKKYNNENENNDYPDFEDTLNEKKDEILKNQRDLQLKINTNEKIFEERNKNIKKIKNETQEIYELTEKFKTKVYEDTEKFDYIENELDKVKDDALKGHSEIKRHNEKAKKRYIKKIFILIGLLFLLLIILYLMFRSIRKKK